MQKAGEAVWLRGYRRQGAKDRRDRRRGKRLKKACVYARYGSPHTGVTNHGSNPIDWNEDVTRADNVNC